MTCNFKGSAEEIWEDKERGGVRLESGPSLTKVTKVYTWDTLSSTAEICDVNPCM
jgi:hypothetical protein